MLRRIVARYMEKSAQHYVRAAADFTKSREFPADDLSWSPLSKVRNRVAKRVTDIAVGAVGTALLAPITAIIAPLIKLDSEGPVFFSQQREGQDGRPITIWKFRSMKNVALEDPAGDWKMRRAKKVNGDDRVTKTGRVLRRFCLDEWPQFASVLLGDLTLIGSRALPSAEIDSIDANPVLNWCGHRTKVRPGLADSTLLFLGKYSSNDRILTELEIYYLGTWTLKRDIYLVFRTLAFMLNGAGK